MLVLSRKIHQSIVIDGNIRITMISVRGQQVRISIDAPQEVPIYRGELLKRPGAVPKNTLPQNPSLKADSGDSPTKKPELPRR